MKTRFGKDLRKTRELFLLHNHTSSHDVDRLCDHSDLWDQSSAKVIKESRVGLMMPRIQWGKAYNLYGLTCFFFFSHFHFTSFFFFCFFFCFVFFLFRFCGQVVAPSLPATSPYLQPSSNSCISPQVLTYCLHVAAAEKENENKLPTDLDDINNHETFCRW